ncbi:MAG: carotenoid biosynthesis protein [Myxococcales bacterium]|nr:carotenoid biosynthesis protein [Myxococcales bacterium]
MLIELVCAGIVALYVVLRARREPGPRVLLRRLALLAIAGWIGEDSVIRAYHFYEYSPRWSLFLDRTPLLIVLIWPVVIHSAWELARQLLAPGRRFIPLVGGALVIADASLIEPIAVQAGLWSWREPGLFGVPPIGILGWGFFAMACMVWLEFGERAGLAETVVDLLVAPLVAHLLLVLAWWLALRWISCTLPGWPAALVAWAVAVTLAALARRQQVQRRVRFDDLLARIPAALFFFVLLALQGGALPSLCAWSLAFAPPYLALCDWPTRRT